MAGESAKRGKGESELPEVWVKLAVDTLYEARDSGLVMDQAAKAILAAVVPLIQADAAQRIGHSIRQRMAAGYTEKEVASRDATRVAMAVAWSFPNDPDD